MHEKGETTSRSRLGVPPCTSSPLRGLHLKAQARATLRQDPLAHRLEVPGWEAGMRFRSWVCSGLAAGLWTRPCSALGLSGSIRHQVHESAHNLGSS